MSSNNKNKEKKNFSSTKNKITKKYSYQTPRKSSKSKSPKPNKKPSNRKTTISKTRTTKIKTKAKKEKVSISKEKKKHNTDKKRSIKKKEPKKAITQKKNLIIKEKITKKVKTPIRSNSPPKVNNTKKVVSNIKTVITSTSKKNELKPSVEKKERRSSKLVISDFNIIQNSNELNKKVIESPKNSNPDEKLSKSAVQSFYSTSSNKTLSKELEQNLKSSELKVQTSSNNNQIDNMRTSFLKNFPNISGKLVESLIQKTSENLKESRLTGSKPIIRVKAGIVKKVRDKFKTKGEIRRRRLKERIEEEQQNTKMDQLDYNFGNKKIERKGSVYLGNIPIPSQFEDIQINIASCCDFSSSSFDSGDSTPLLHHEEETRPIEIVEELWMGFEADSVPVHGLFSNRLQFDTPDQFLELHCSPLQNLNKENLIEKIELLPIWEINEIQNLIPKEDGIITEAPRESQKPPSNQKEAKAIISGGSITSLDENPLNGFNPKIETQKISNPSPNLKKYFVFNLESKVKH